MLTHKVEFKLNFTNITIFEFLFYEVVEALYINIYGTTKFYQFIEIKIYSIFIMLVNIMIYPDSTVYY